MVPVVSPEEAVSLIRSGQTVLVSGSGTIGQVPDRLLKALEDRYLSTKEPRDLTIFHVMGLGDNGRKGLNQLAHEGLLRRAIGSHYGHNPDLIRMIQEDQIEAFGLPGGVMAQLCREIAGGRLGLITHVGLGTYVDPRVEGGRLNRRTQGSYAQLIELAGQERLFYPSIPIDVALIAATTADEEGNLTMEDECAFGTILPMAQAAHASGGLVIAQVKRLAARGSLPPKAVKVPGILVDRVVLYPEAMQTAVTQYSPYLAGVMRAPSTSIPPIPLDERKVIARRGALELWPGALVNLGYGVGQGVSAIAAEEGVYEQITLTIEQGIVGGLPGIGLDGGSATNPQAIIDDAYQFDFYDGGGLDIAYLSFGEFDRLGNVNVTKLGGRAVGPGGFINIAQNARTVVFCGTLTGGGLRVQVGGGTLKLLQEGRYQKVVDRVEQISYNAEYGLRRGQRILYMSERALFRRTPEGVVLEEVAPGVDLERDVLAHLAFRPLISPNLRTMEERIFREEPIGLAEWLRGRTPPEQKGGPGGIPMAGFGVSPRN